MARAGSRSRRRSRPISSTSPSTSLDSPPHTVANRGLCPVSSPAARMEALDPRRRLPCFLSQSLSSGKVAITDRSIGSPAWRPPRSGSTSTREAFEPKRRRRRLPSASSPSPFRAGRTRSSKAFSFGPLGSPCQRRRSPMSEGMPKGDRSGYAISSPRVQTYAPHEPGITTSSSRPSSRHSSTAQGLRTTKESAPASTGRPSTSIVRSFPPGRSLASSTVTSGVGPELGVFRRAWAAARPPMPAPTTTTCGACELAAITKTWPAPPRRTL